MPARILHIMEFDGTNPQYIVRTLCGKYVRSFEIAKFDIEVSCDKCKEKEKEYERNEVWWK